MKTVRIELTEQERKEAKNVMGIYLAMLRKTLLLSQTEFGSRTGISRIRLSRIECGKQDMSWAQFNSFLFLFLMNRSTCYFIVKNKLFSERLLLFLQGKREGESPDFLISLK